MPFNVTEEDAPGLRARARETKTVLNTVLPDPRTEIPKTPAPPAKVDRVRPKATYGTQKGEKRFSDQELKDMAKPLGIPSYKKGTDAVPKTGPAMLHKGEAVVPAEKNPMNPYSKITEGTKKPKKTLKSIHTRKAKDGSYIHEHNFHHVDHKMEEHTSKDMAAALAHMAEHAPSMEHAQPEEPTTGAEAQDQALGM